MRLKLSAAVTALALASAVTAFPAFAQQYPTGRNINDGGIPAQPSGAPEYNGNGQVVPAGGEVGSNLRNPLPFLRSGNGNLSRLRRTPASVFVI